MWLNVFCFRVEIIVIQLKRWQNNVFIKVSLCLSLAFLISYLTVQKYIYIYIGRLMWNQYNMNSTSVIMNEKMVYYSIMILNGKLLWTTDFFKKGVLLPNNFLLLYQSQWVKNMFRVFRYFVEKKRNGCIPNLLWTCFHWFQFMF